ncbi:L,D-transpeptidase [Lutibacter sp. B2]|nr:L,D-transpeptidase [Lutibacter sp. B2]
MIKVFKESRFLEMHGDDQLIARFKVAIGGEVKGDKTHSNWYTELGGEVGIHGGRTSTDWTWGCMALSDKDIRILWTYAKLKTPVEIYE